MQKIKYQLCQLVNVGTEEEPKYEEVLYGKKLPYSESNLELAKAEAHNGEYEVYDDGQPEPEPTPAGEAVTWDELDAAYQAGYAEGYTEGVTGAYDQ